MADLPKDAAQARVRASTDWMPRARWGVLVHYLAVPPDAADGDADLSPAAWNRRVDSFGVDGFVNWVVEVGAGYVIFTVGQNSGHYCAPNATYDALVGRTPSKLSQRDLIGECGSALAKVGIRLIAYLPSHAPARDHMAAERLRFTPAWDARAWGFKPEPLPGAEKTDERLSEAQRNWEAVIREWSLRWGALVAWLVD